MNLILITYATHIAIQHWIYACLYTALCMNNLGGTLQLITWLSMGHQIQTLPYLLIYWHAIWFYKSRSWTHSVEHIYILTLGNVISTICSDSLAHNEAMKFVSFIACSLARAHGFSYHEWSQLFHNLAVTFVSITTNKRACRLAHWWGETIPDLCCHNLNIYEIFNSCLFFYCIYPY